MIIQQHSLLCAYLSQGSPWGGDLPNLNPGDGDLPTPGMACYPKPPEDGDIFPQG